MSTFFEQLKKIAEQCPAPDMAQEAKRQDLPTCKMCHETRVINKHGRCARCQVDHDRGYAVSTKTGRCANGAERDGGTLFHARLLKTDGYPKWVPVCGVAPGRRSAGWSEWRPYDTQPVTCPRCLKKLERMAK